MISGFPAASGVPPRTAVEPAAPPVAPVVSPGTAPTRADATGPGPRLLSRLKDIYIRDPGPLGNGEMVSPEFVFEVSYGYVGRSETFRFAEHMNEPDVVEFKPWFMAMVLAVRAAGSGRTEFSFRYPDSEAEGVTWRVRKDADPEEALRAMYICRQIPRVVPPLAEMSYPRFWPELFCCRDWKAGGLVVMVSATGQGKSTTLAAIMRRRLELYAGHGRTVEDPIELPMAGSWGAGECHQTEIPRLLDGEPVPREKAWQMALSACMRGFPSIPDSKILLVGEIRDPASAVEAIMAAASGHLVLTTVHGGSVIEGIRRIGGFAATALGSDMANDFFGGSFLAAIHQKMRMTDRPGWQSRAYSGTLLVSSTSGDDGAPSPVASCIRRGEYAKLNNEIDQQRAKYEAVLNAVGQRQYDNARPEERMAMFERWYESVTKPRTDSASNVR